MHTVILARYNEALEWIVDIPVDFKVIIYNKGGEITSPEVLERADEIIARPNIGRESETYIHHMMTRKADNRDFTVFSQGDPLTHSPDFIDLLKNWRIWDDVQTLAWRWIEKNNIPPAETLARHAENFPIHLRVRPEIYSLLDWRSLEFNDPGAWNMGLVFKTLEGISPNTSNIAAYVLKKFKLDQQAEDAARHTVGIFSYGAIFAVRNDRIARLSDESKQLIYDFSTAAANANGYILERMWLHMFGMGFYRRVPFIDQHSSALSLPGVPDTTRVDLSNLVLGLADQGMSMDDVGALLKGVLKDRLDELKQEARQAALD